MTKIFISYRREDSADVTGRIGDRLRDHFGRENVFTDVDNIPLGVDFRTHLDNKVSQCDVFLAVIGKDWLSVENSDGELRLNDPADFVRIEIESALRRDIPAIPLLVRGASIPQKDQLPESIEDLAFRHAQKIRPDPDFNNDANRLVQSLIKLFESDTPEQISVTPVTPERAEEPRLPVGRWQPHKFLWLGVIASTTVAVTIFYLLRDLERVEPEQQDRPLPEIRSSTPTPEAPAIDYIPPDMVQIPADTFMMGSDTGDSDERPVHQVIVPTFEIARNELTWAEWRACEDAAGCNRIERLSFFEKIDPSEQSRHPVVMVNVASVNEYLIWINGRTGRKYRLPSEAEWEHATRVGNKTNYYWGIAIGENRANCKSCGSQWDKQSTAPVGSFDASPFGLNDVHGNVWEWVADCWHDSYSGAPVDGSAWVDNCTDEDRNVLRGGSWSSRPELLRAANRDRNYADGAYNDVGFRLARTLP